MANFERRRLACPVLATDLDGTLIPAQSELGSAQDQLALDELHQYVSLQQLELVFVTGRHLSSILEAIDQFRLPLPNWVIGDVGSSIYRQPVALTSEVTKTDDANRTVSFTQVTQYKQHLESICPADELAEMHARFAFDLSIERQEAEKQQPHKLSYYCDANELESIVEKMEEVIQRDRHPVSIVHSIDPDDDCGLIDLMPRGVNKAYALQWWSDHIGHDRSRVVYAGDSGNDLAALTSGVRGIVVGNASRDLRHKLDRTGRHLIDQGLIYFAKNGYTTGVVEGARHHRLLPALND